MFDWDQDVEALTAPVIVPPVARPVARARRGNGRIRRALVRFGAPLAVVLALGVGVGVSPGLSSVALGALDGWMPGLDGRMPAGLRVYDQSQFDAFRRGIAGFTDAELLDYERATLHGHLVAGLLLADFSHDALLLTHREIERRGLTRPLASLRQGERRLAIVSPAGAI